MGACTYQVGRVKVHLLSDGVFWTDGGTNFGVVPKTLWEKVIRADELNRIPMQLRCLLIESDAGMVRSGNRDVAREFARELGYAYAFAPCYLSLVKGSGLEYHAEGDNDLGLHGNAILSRYPIRNVRSIALKTIATPVLALCFVWYRLTQRTAEI